MKITSDLAEATVLQALGTRLERHRIEAGLTQAALAEQAGISKRTLERTEAGLGCELTTLIRLLRILKLSEGFDTLIPELPPSPMAQLKLQGRQRQRVVHSRKKTALAAAAKSPPKKTWTWAKGS